jgi:hypothetical protein
MTRVPIPEEVATDVLFAANRTCCVCRVPGKSLQLHHIDGDHSNSLFDNLGALCLECHNETQRSGGFGRQLNASLVRRHRDDWNARVRERRDVADRIAASVMASPGRVESKPSARPPMLLHDFVRLLPPVRASAYHSAREDWDSGVTARMVQATYRIVDVLEDVLASLATYYPAGHFDRENPRDYISELLATRFRWHRYRHERHGKGKNGTIVQTLVAGSVLADVERMIEEMVGSLTLDWSGETSLFGQWKMEWERGDHIDSQGLRRRSATDD